MDGGVVHYNVGHTPKPRALFKPGSWLKKIDFINHLVLFNNVLVTVLAEKKGGKTAFSSLLQSSLDQQVNCISLTLKPPCDKEDLISAIAKALHVKKDKHTTIESLVDHMNDRKIHTLCLIDDAHHLTDEVIKTFVSLIKKQNDFGFFHLCLVSDYSIEPSLGEITAREQCATLIHTVELGTLTESESRTYVLQRAIEAGLINKPLTEMQFKQYHQITKGNIAKINANLEEYVDSCASKSSKVKKSKAPKLKVAFGSALVAALAYGGFYCYQHWSYPIHWFSPSKQQPVAVIKKAGPAVIQLTSYIAAWQEGATHQYMEVASPKKQYLAGLEEEPELNTEAIVDRVVVLPKVRFQTVDSQAIELALSSQLASIPVLPLQKSEVTLSKPVAKKSVKKNRYTIQFAAGVRQSDVDRLQRSNPLFSHAKVRHVGSWYILTLGEYQSRQHAAQQLDQLPSTLTQLKPWIRPLSTAVG